MTAGRVLRALFVAYVAATAVHIALIMAHEPFAFDAWNVAVDTGARPFSFGRWLDYGIYEYTHSNPRLGQWWTYLAYKLTAFAPIATPAVYLALAAAVTVLGLGRWPGGADSTGQRRLGRDLALAAIAIGYGWFALPRIGMIMFCRAYSANYVYGAALQLWFLVPLRLARGEASPRQAIGYGVLGTLAGMCNEHTGPTLILLVAGYALWQHRTGGRPRLALAGAVGAAVGFAAIFFAPGQGSRYDGLATKVSLVGRLLQRGVTNNLDIFNNWLLGCAPVLGLIVIALIVARDDEDPDRLRPALRLVGVALAAGTLVTATVFVSPKLGPRFYFAGCAGLLAGWIAVADRALTSPRRLAPFVVLAALASIYAGVRTLPLYDRLDRASDERLAALRASAPGSVVTAESFEQVEDSWWFLGDDFRDIKKRELISDYYGLRGVILRAVDVTAPLGVSDIQLAPRYQVTPAGCLDAGGALDLGVVRGLDITALHKAMQAAIARLRDKLATAGTRLDRLDFVVDFLGAPPVLPRPSLVVGRWTPAGFEGHAGAIERRGATKTRTIKLPPELTGKPYEIYIYQVDGEARRLGTARDAALEFVPWKRGAYWALACGPDECFVIAAMRYQ